MSLFLTKRSRRRVIKKGAKSNESIDIKSLIALDKSLLYKNNDNVSETTKSKSDIFEKPIVTNEKLEDSKFGNEVSVQQIDLLNRIYFVLQSVKYNVSTR